MTGFTIRTAVPDDALAVAAVHVRTWQAAYRGLLPDAYLDALRVEDRARRYTFGSSLPAAPHTLVAIDQGAVVGFATVRVEDPAEAIGELAALHVDPAHWHRHAGVQLITAARADLLARGCTDAHLWLLAGNHRAERFYRRDGWSPSGTQRVDRVWGVEVTEIGFRRRLRP